MLTNVFVGVSGGGRLIRIVNGNPAFPRRKKVPVASSEHEFRKRSSTGIVNVIINDSTESLDLRNRESVVVDIPNDSGRREGGFIGGGLSKGDSDDSTRNMRNRTDTELGRGRMMRFPD